MKLTEKLANAIRRGILRIFPKVSHSVSDSHSIFPFTFRTFAKVAFAIAIAIACLGCSTTKQTTTQLVHDIRTDTIYLNSRQYDSIYIYKDKYVDRTRDTLYIRDRSIEYHYKMLRDTIKVVQHDSIPYEVTIIETKEITRPLTWFDKVSRTITIAIALALLAYLLEKSRNLALYVLKIFR